MKIFCSKITHAVSLLINAFGTFAVLETPHNSYKIIYHFQLTSSIFFFYQNKCYSFSVETGGFMLFVDRDSNVANCFGNDNLQRPQ